MKNFAGRRPVAFVSLVALAPLVVGLVAHLAAPVGTPLVAPWLAPILWNSASPVDQMAGAAPDYTAAVGRLLATLLLLALTGTLLTGLKAWSWIGLRRLWDWAAAMALVLVLVLSLLGGGQASRPATAAPWVALAVSDILQWLALFILYFAVILRTLLPMGTVPAVAVSSLLYGLHVLEGLFVSSLLYGPQLLEGLFFAESLKRVLFAYGRHVLFGFGLAAAAWRMGTIWPLVLLRVLIGFVLGAGVTLAVAVISAACGLYLLRQERFSGWQAGALRTLKALRQARKGPGPGLRWTGRDDHSFRRD